MSVWLSLPASAELIEQPRGTWSVRCDGDSVGVAGKWTGVREAMKHLVAGRATEEEVCDAALAIDGFAVLQPLLESLSNLAHAGLLRHVVSIGDSPAITVVSWGPFPASDLSPRGADDPVLLSRFAYLRREEGVLLVESPRSRMQVFVHDPRVAAFIGDAVRGCSARELAAAHRDISEEGIGDIVQALWGAGLLARPDESRNTGEPASAIWSWEFHDLLFHARSRAGRHAYPSGQTYRLRDVIARPPVVKPSGSPDRRVLVRPNLDTLAANDPSLTNVIESRRSRRAAGATAITVDQLGEFLFRTARLQEIIPLEHSEVSRRPYPGGGASYELEIYPVVRMCTGLRGGLYHYCARDHALDPLACDPADLEALLDGAATAAGADPPHILLIVSARFQRVSWKYSSIAYAVILKDVGVLYQTMYLVAEAMGLAACALGNGDADLFARVTGTDYYEEGSVGEFMLSAGSGHAAGAG